MGGPRPLPPREHSGVLTREPSPLQQWRLLPYLAAAYALDHFSKSLFLDLMQLQQGLLGDDRSARQVRAPALSPRVCGDLNQTGRRLPRVPSACPPLRAHAHICMGGGGRRLRSSRGQSSAAVVLGEHGGFAAP